MRGHAHDRAVHTYAPGTCRESAWSKHFRVVRLMNHLRSLAEPFHPPRRLQSPSTSRSCVRDSRYKIFPFAIRRLERTRTYWNPRDKVSPYRSPPGRLSTMSARSSPGRTSVRLLSFFVLSIKPADVIRAGLCQILRADTRVAIASGEILRACRA